MDLQLTPDELEALRGMLRREWGYVREEAYKTEDYDYKKVVKEREALIQSIMQKVGLEP